MKSIKSIAGLAASLIAASAFTAAHAADQKCGAGTCGKKETSKPAGKGSDKGKEAACSKKEASCSKK